MLLKFTISQANKTGYNYSVFTVKLIKQQHVLNNVLFIMYYNL